MSSRLLVLIIIIVISVSLYFTYTNNESYKKSVEAKISYFLKDYNNAYTLADEAYKLDHYNRMALTILTQSKNSIKYLDYIKNTNVYYKKIDKITNKKRLNSEDRARILMMCKVAIDDYDDIMKYKTSFTDDDLIQEATDLKNKFQIILNSLQDKGDN